MRLGNDNDVSIQKIDCEYGDQEVGKSCTVKSVMCRLSDYSEHLSLKANQKGVKALILVA